MHYLLPIIAMSAFATSLSARTLDPLMPQISAQLLVSATVAATLASAFSVTFALAQPAVGIVADRFGKARLILVHLIILGLGNFAGAFSNSFEMLFATRIICGIGAGGVFPITLGLVGDLFPIAERQVAMSRVLAGAMTGNVIGATFAGLVGDLVGWRGVLIGIGGLLILASATVAWGFRNVFGNRSQAIRLRDLSSVYREIFSHPHAIICFAAVLVEGAVVFGIFPFVASFLAEIGEVRLSIAGIVIAGFAIGGLVYSIMVSRLLRRYGVGRLMMGGAALMASQLILIAFDPRWEVQLVLFVLLGTGFYLLHGSIQTFVSEISVMARSMAISVHSFSFFLGQSIGPIAYGYGLSTIGRTPVLLMAATVLLVLGIACVQLLRPVTAPPDRP